MEGPPCLTKVGNAGYRKETRKKQTRGIVMKNWKQVDRLYKTVRNLMSRD